VTVCASALCYPDQTSKREVERRSVLPNREGGSPTGKKKIALAGAREPPGRQSINLLESVTNTGRQQIAKNKKGYLV